MDFKDLKNKTWIDWIKVVVAVDIAFIGFGFILDEDIHILSHIFGFLTRIPFGIIYIFIAILILKQVFPKALHIDSEDSIDFATINEGVEKGVIQSKNFLKHFLYTINISLKKLITWVDRLLDRIAHFFEKRHKEVTQEVKDLMDETDIEKKP